MVIKKTRRPEMSLINDYTYQAMTDEREREIARQAEQNWHIRAALSGRQSWWQRLLARRAHRVQAATKQPIQVAR
jgi:hypothetical protein